MLAFTSDNISRHSRPVGRTRSALLRAMATLIAGAVLAIALPMAAAAQEGLSPGEGFLTKFSGTATVTGDGGPRTVIDRAGTVGTAIDLRAPGFAADGRHWRDPPHLFAVTAGDVGQVFGVTLDDATPPNIYLTATAAFGLHRNADNSGWMDGMWGPGGGPGTVYRLAAANDYRPEIFAEITLDGRPNSGAALGNIAFDRQHHQLFVSDLETGMIHRLALADGSDLGSYDHGVTGRGSFVDAASGASQSLPPIAFDPTTSAHVDDCPTGDFARTPSCWNFADFRRRVWGLDVRSDPGGDGARLYYAVWGSQGFGNPDWATAGEDQQNSVWSVAIAEDGSVDPASVRREFVLPEFFRSPEAIARAGISNPVADIAFPRFGSQDVMLVAERGGIRNLGLSAEDAFAHPDEARVLRYERGADGVWQPAGRYDVGFYDRKNEGPPYLRAGAAGGAAFAMGYDASGRIDPARPDQFVWMTGDGLCAPDGPCFDPASGTESDTSEVTGLQGQAESAYADVIPEAAFQPYPAPGPAYPATGPRQSYMVDADVGVDPSGIPIPEELTRNDATRVGDVAIVQQAAAKPDLEIAKQSLDGACHAGEDCRYEITITNVGDVPYAGPLSVRDTPTEGAELTMLPPDWTCTPLFGGIQECRHEPVDLAPGAEISFQVAVRVPDWWSRPVYENCVDLTMPGAGEDARTYNNHACGYGPTAEPGTPYYAPDLQLSKFGIGGQCDWTGECWFVVRITNVGAAPYSGPLGFHDEIAYPGATLVGWGPGPGWMCGPPGGASFNCAHPPVTLGPGDFREVLLRFAAPPPIPGHSHVRNCGWIDWGGAAGDYNPGNEYDCASVSRFPPGFPGARPMLDIRKETTAAVCDAGAGPGGGWACRYAMRITNVGGAPFFGPMEIGDMPTDPAATLITASAPWTCLPGAGAAGTQTCGHPGIAGGLQPGESTLIWIAFEMPAAVAVPGELENCARIASDHDGDGFAEYHTSCATAQICTAGFGGNCPQDLSISKGMTSFDPCYPGFPCQFMVRLRNIGAAAFHGPVDVTDVPPPGAGPFTLVTAPAGTVCAPVGANQLCSYPGDMPPGAEFIYVLNFMIPPGYPATTFENCASIPAGPENTVASNDEDCSTAYVPFPDMGPEGGTLCQRGADCTLPLGMKNFGLLPFVGTAGVRGVLSPAVPIVSITPQTPGVTCTVTGEGTYECLGHNLTVQPGESVKWQAVIHIAEDFPADQITHTKDMVWPDRKVKDKRPDNDRNVSIIEIAGPKEPPTPARVHDLKVEKRGQAGCERGQPCRFTVVVTNVGEDTYLGPLVLDDVGLASARLTSYSPPWTCLGGGGHYTCTYPSATLAPGASVTLTLTLVTDDSLAIAIDNCASLHWTDTSRLRAVQQRLNELGFSAGEPDGKLGPQTRRAIMDFQESVHLPATGRVDNTLLNQLFVSWGTGDSNAGNDRGCAVVSLPPAFTTISCTGGRVVDDRCVCPQGTEVQQVGTHSYRCVTPEQRLICTGGKIVNDRCFCPRGSELRQTGRNAFACVAVRPTITCTGGTVRNDECICPRGAEAQQVGENAYSCVPSIACQGGSVRNNECICRRGFVAQQTGRNAYRCVRPQPEITCKGGQLRNNECICPPRTEVQRTGPTAFACVAVRPTITCTGGTVRNNDCICPRGTERQQVGDNAYRCVKPQPEITCKGGKVDNNRCICPRGSEVRQIGRTAFACIAPPPQIRCSGGTVRNNECVCPRGMEARRVSNTLYRCVKAQDQTLRETPQVTPSAPTTPQPRLILPQQLLVPR